MGVHFFKSVKKTTKHWYLPLISGIVLIAAGIWTFTEPGDSYVALAFLFSLSFFVSGLFDSIFSIVNRDIIDNWGWSLVMGLITLAVGVLMLMNPAISMITLPFYMGFVILFRSMSAIGTSLDLKNYGIMDWGNLMALGIVGVLIGFILLWNPILAGFSAVIWTGIGLIVIGIYSIMASMKLKKIHDVPKKISKELLKRYNEAEDEIIDALDKS